jgi:hypothetical protein
MYHSKKRKRFLAKNHVNFGAALHTQPEMSVDDVKESEAHKSSPVFQKLSEFKESAKNANELISMIKRMDTSRPPLEGTVSEALAKSVAEDYSVICKTAGDTHSLAYVLLIKDAGAEKAVAYVVPQELFDEHARADTDGKGGFAALIAGATQKMQPPPPPPPPSDSQPQHSSTSNEDRQLLVPTQPVEGLELISNYTLAAQPFTEAEICRLKELAGDPNKATKEDVRDPNDIMRNTKAQLLASRAQAAHRLNKTKSNGFSTAGADGSYETGFKKALDITVDPAKSAQISASRPSPKKSKII